MVQREKRVKLLYELNLILWLAVFLGALNWRLQEVLWNEPTVETLIILLLLPVFAYVLLYSLLKRRLWPVVVFIIIASAIILTKYIGEIVTWRELVPGKEEFELASFLVFLAFAGVELLTLAVGHYLRRKQSVWLLLVGAILAQMIIFSYFDRSFSVTVPLGIISALILQATIKVEEQPGSLRVSDGFGGRKPGKIMLPRRRRLAWTMLILVLAFYLGWNVPAFKAVWFQGTTREAFLDQVNDQINNLTGEGPIVTNDIIFSWNFTNPGRSWYPDDQQPLFYVQSSKPTYWRSQVFDVYSGSGYQQWAWYNTEVDTFQPTNLPLELDPLVEDSTVKMTGQVQAVTSLSEGVGLLLPYNSTEITGVSSRKNFEYSPELQTVLTQEPLKAGTTYQVEAIAPDYTKEDLRKIESLPSQAPGFELKWFTAYYDGLLPGVEELTAEAKNPYDKIELMADYLRTNGTYTLDPARSSPDMMTDFFATGEGYCVQFSSALTLMAQSLGYPARWVVGFSEGEPLPPGATNPFPDEPRSTVRVLTQADAHAWAEVYFPGYGWIPFEATPGYSNPVEPREKIEWPAATLPDVEGTDKSPRDIERDIKEDSYSTAETSVTSWVLAGLVGGLGILGGIYWYWRHWYARLPERKKMQMLYRKWVRRLRFGGIKIRSNETPHEFALRTKHLGAEWVTVWSDFTGLAEEAYYAQEVDNGQLVRMQALAQRLKLIYRKDRERKS